MRVCVSIELLGSFCFESLYDRFLINADCFNVNNDWIFTIEWKKRLAYLYFDVRIDFYVDWRIFFMNKKRLVEWKFI